MAINDRPVVIDFVVGADAQVWPMVAAGTGNDELMAARSIRPLFDGDELNTDVDTEADVDRSRRRGTRRTHDGDAHAVGARRGQARRARPRLGAVLPARVQHRLARGGPHRAAGHLADDDRGRPSRTSRSSRSPSSSTSSCNVIKIVELEPAQSVQRELLLVKVRADATVRSQVLETVKLFRAKVVDVSPESLTIEATGTADKITHCCACSSPTASARWCSPAWSPWAAGPAPSPPHRRASKSRQTALPTALPLDHARRKDALP